MDHRPPIIVSTLDAARLESLLDQCSPQQQAELADLQAELARAQLVEPEDMPADVVTLNSTVTFEMAASAQTFSLTLVHPRDLGDGVGRVSVLAPVGSALLGLREGDTMSWPRPGGGMMAVRVLQVVYQPERAGELTR